MIVTMPDGTRLTMPDNGQALYVRLPYGGDRAGPRPEPPRTTPIAFNDGVLEVVGADDNSTGTRNGV